jgi:hypothetical protein
MDEQPPVAFGAVGPPSWSDRPAFLVGGGASLKGFDFGELPFLGYVLGVNQSIFHVDCSAGISIDRLFVQNTTAPLEAFAKHRELYLAPGNTWWKQIGPVAGAIYLKNIPDGLSDDPATLATGGTSGYAALNLAVLKGAKRIVLLGYDYGLIDGQHHYHDAYPWHHQANDQSWPSWAKQFDAMAPSLKELGVDVVNASPSSAISCFAKMSIEDALTWAQ